MPGLKAITANTDPAAKAHVYAEDDAAIFQSIVGADGVFDIGQKCAATILSNNQVRVEDGVVCIGGHFARIPYGDYADFSIANGQSGYNRNDIIVAKIVSTGFGGIDTMTCEVKQGEAGVTALDPSITKGNMYAGELEREFPLYRVRIEGLSIAGVDQLFDVIPTIPQTEERIVALEKKADELNSKTVHFITYSHPEFSVSANGETSISFVVNPPSGYKALTIIPYQTGAAGVFYEGCVVSYGTNITVWIYNTTSTTKNAKLVCDIVCVKI